MADHLGVDAGQIEVGRLVLAAAGDDHFGFQRLAEQGLHDRLHRQQFQIDGGIELIKDHGLVEPTGDGGPGDLPGALCLHVIDGLLLTAPDDGITAGAQVVHQMRVALP